LSLAPCDSTSFLASGEQGWNGEAAAGSDVLRLLSGPQVRPLRILSQGTNVMDPGELVLQRQGEICKPGSILEVVRHLVRKSIKGDRRGRRPGPALASSQRGCRAHIVRTVCPPNHPRMGLCLLKQVLSLDDEWLSIPADLKVHLELHLLRARSTWEVQGFVLG